MSGKLRKQQNGGRRPRANRHGGSGRGFNRGVAVHPGEEIDTDLEKAERRRIEQEGLPLSPEPKLEVLPGVPHRSFVPALGRQVSGSELTEVLLEAEKKKPTFYAPNPGRKPKPWQPAGGTEFAHGQLRYDGFLAMRWGQLEGLPSPNPVLDSILRDFEPAFKAEYGEGYIVEAVCLHMPNPNLEAELKNAGWRGTVSKEPCDKLGRNNVHIQVYLRRLADAENKRLVADITLFAHAGDSVISSMQLRELGVDLDEHREAKLENELEKKYLQGDSFHRTGEGRKGRPLPPKLREKVDGGKMDLREAIARAIATDLKRKRASMANAKTFKTLAIVNQEQVSRYEKAKAFDLWLSQHFTMELDKRLRALHPRYGELLDMAPGALREVKAIQVASKHKLLFNEALTLWERAYRETIQRKKDEEKDTLLANLKAELEAAAANHATLLDGQVTLKHQLDAAVAGSDEAVKLKAELETMSGRLAASEKQTEQLKQRDAELQASVRVQEAKAMRFATMGKRDHEAAMTNLVARLEDTLASLRRGSPIDERVLVDLKFTRKNNGKWVFPGKWPFDGTWVSTAQMQARFHAFQKSAKAWAAEPAPAPLVPMASVEKLVAERTESRLASHISEMETAATEVVREMAEGLAAAEGQVKALSEAAKASQSRFARMALRVFPALKDALTVVERAQAGTAFTTKELEAVREFVVADDDVVVGKVRFTDAAKQLLVDLRDAGACSEEFERKFLAAFELTRLDALVLRDTADALRGETSMGHLLKDGRMEPALRTAAEFVCRRWRNKDGPSGIEDDDVRLIYMAARDALAADNQRASALAHVAPVKPVQIEAARLIRD